MLREDQTVRYVADMKNRTIALLTDFSYEDPFIGMMKGVIYSINPSARIVDLAHNLPKYDVRTAAFILLTSYKYFPPGTIFCCVVDPGVGTNRRAIAIKTKKYYFIGPDNGCMLWAANDDSIDVVVEITNRKYMLEKISTTFHGRDIFAPASAHLSRGVDISELGKKINPNSLVRIEFPQLVIQGNRYELEVLAVDGFGNIFLNIRTEQIDLEKGENVSIIVGDKRYIARVVKTYGEAEKGSLVVLCDTSHGYLEIAVNQGSAKSVLGVDVGDRIIIVD